MIDNLTINFECNGIAHTLSIPTRDENLPYNLATAFKEVINKSSANAGMVIKELTEEFCDKPSCVKAPQWISVNDRLPAMDKEVIALNNEGKISFAHRVNTMVENHYRGWNIPSVEYWMPFSNPLED